MKQFRQLFLKFCLGMLVGFGCIFIIYCITLPAIPFVYVGF